MRKFNIFILIIISMGIFANISLAVPKYLKDEKSTEPLFSGFSKVVTVPKNYKLSVELKTPLNINNIAVPDKVELNLTNDFIYKGQLIAPEGSLIIGNVIRINRLQNSTNSIKVTFTAIITPDNQVIPIFANFATKDNKGLLFSDSNGDFLPEENANIIIMQPVTYVPKK